MIIILCITQEIENQPRLKNFNLNLILTYNIRHIERQFNRYPEFNFTWAIWFTNLE